MTFGIINAQSVFLILGVQEAGWGGGHLIDRTRLKERCINQFYSQNCYKRES